MSGKNQSASDRLSASEDRRQSIESQFETTGEKIEALEIQVLLRIMMMMIMMMMMIVMMMMMMMMMMLMMMLMLMLMLMSVACKRR